MYTCICNNIPFLGANLPDGPGQSNRHLTKELLNKTQDVYMCTLSFTKTLLGPSYKVAMIWYLETLYVGGQLLVHIHQTEKMNTINNFTMQWFLYLGGAAVPIGTLKHNPVYGKNFISLCKMQTPPLRNKDQKSLETF